MADHDDMHSDQHLSPDIKRKRYLRYAITSIVVMIILFLFYWLLVSRFYVETDNAYVNGNIVQVSTQTSGTIKTIYADTTDYVQQGQALFVLEQHDADVRLARARANLAKSFREVQQFIQAVQQNQAIVVLRQAELSNSISVFNRRAALWKTRNVSQEAWQDAKAAKDVAEAQYQRAVHELESSIALVKNSTVFDHPIVEAAKADFRNAYLDKERTIVYSPVSGYVAKRNAQVGSLATAGMIMYAIVPLDEIWVDANFKETQLSRLRIGQPVKLIADTNDKVYHGKIAGFYPGTGSVFSLLPAQNASGNWIKITQRLPVRINLDKKEIKESPLEIGLSMQATVNTHNLNLPYLNSKRLVNKPRYSTDIYQRLLKNADAEILSIYQEQIKPTTQYDIKTKRSDVNE